MAGLAGWHWSEVALAAVLCGALAANCNREAEPPRLPAQESPSPGPPSPGSPSPEATRHLIYDSEVDELREAGLRDPVKQLVDSLAAHPEIIPHPGVHGGRMVFSYPRDVHILNASTVYARFTDGHIEGSGIFEFTVEPDGRIVWRVLSSTVDPFSEEPARADSEGR